ncbi:MAG: hypothetical protein ACYDH5_07080 [Acidimicrobiales bacterium]
MGALQKKNSKCRNGSLEEKAMSYPNPAGLGIGPAPAAVDQVPAGFFHEAVPAHALPAMSVTTSPGVAPAVPFLRLGCDRTAAVAQIGLAGGSSAATTARSYGTAVALGKGQKLTLAYGVRSQ